jgi:hypothetical protein
VNVNVPIGVSSLVNAIRPRQQQVEPEAPDAQQQAPAATHWTPGAVHPMFSNPPGIAINNDFARLKDLFHNVFTELRTKPADRQAAGQLAAAAAAAQGAEAVQLQ